MGQDISGAARQRGPRRRGRAPGLTSRAPRWSEFRQQVRAHKPSELLPAIAAASARRYDGGPLKVDPRDYQPWVLAGIARESLAYGNEHRTAPVTHKALAALHDTYMNLADPVLIQDGFDHRDLFLRVIYEQVDWQGAGYPEMARIGALFDRDFDAEYEVLTRQAVADLLGADARTYFGAALIFTTSAQHNQGRMDLSWLAQPQFAPVVAVIPETVLRDIFLRAFAATREVVAARCRERRNAEPELRKYDINPLVATPFVGMGGEAYLAPATKLVADRASLAAVYHLGLAKWQDAFTRDLGRLVEAYAGEQLGLVPGGTLTPERPYGRGSGSRTVDWILVLPRVVVLVEVKSARVAQPGRTGLTEFVADVKRDVGKGLGQIATTARLITDGDPVMDDVPKDRPLRGIVVTAEPHHLINAPEYREELPDPTVPSAVLSLEELENAVTITLAMDPSTVFADLTDWQDGSGVDLGDAIPRLHDQTGLTTWDNPVLDAAWSRYPFMPDDL